MLSISVHHGAMQTTVKLDRGAQGLLKEAARRSGRTFNQVLDDAARVGLQGHALSAASFKQPTFPLGKSLVDLTKAGALATELEDRRA